MMAKLQDTHTVQNRSLQNERNATANHVHVYLVGAGPGDPGLCTVTGTRLISKADVIIYDYLVNSVLLEGARADAELIYAGKKGFSAHLGQDKINVLLIEKARELEENGGGVLVRLKGGDPFVFGRGGEEALAFSKAGISFSVVPGVTSGVAAPAYAGIPVTHRGLASSVAFITGNEDPTKEETALDWDAIAKSADTLCFYMGVRNLPFIAERLMTAGRAADTPVALVRWGTMPDQEVLEGTLATISDDALAAGFKAPAIIVVGKVVGLRDYLEWFNPGPLAGMTVAVTRTRAQASSLTSKLRQLGATVLELPTIEIVPLRNYAEVDTAISHLADYRFIVFTSANGVTAFFDRLTVAGLDARSLARARIAVIGPATAKVLKSYGITADYVPHEYRAEAVAQMLIDAGLMQGDRVLIPRALEAREVLPDLLKQNGAYVDVVPVYRTMCPASDLVQDALGRIAAGEVDAVTFTSSSTVRNFDALVREVGCEKILADMSLYSIGPITSDTARKEGLVIAAQAEDYTIEGLVDAMVKHRTSHNTRKGECS